jgi:hypothetical protein
MLLNDILSSLQRNHFLKYIGYRLFGKKVHISGENILADAMIFRQERPFIAYQTELFHPVINALFNKWASSGEQEYLVQYRKGGLLEPLYGWLLNERNEVIKKSLPYGETNITPLPHYTLYRKKNILHIKTGVSIRYNWFNYWHFYNDVMGQLYFLDKINFDKSIPVILPEKALELPYVQAFFKTSYAKQRNWIFQSPSTFIELDSVYFCKSIPNIKAQFLFAANIFKDKKDSAPMDRRIFVTRKQHRGRSLVNQSEIHKLMRAYHFEIVECDDLSMEQQINIFASGRVIAGIHGAGLTNMIYRHPLPCSVLEIFPPDNTPTHYYWLARELGYSYRAVLGHSLQGNAFVADKDLIESELKLLPELS